MRMQRYFWLLNVAFVVCAAYLVAGSITEHLAASLFSERVVPPLEEADEAAPLPRILPAGPRDSDPVTTLVARNVFNAERRPEDETPPAPQPEPEPEPEPGEEELQESELDLVLMGTMVAEGQPQKLAVVEMGGATRLARVGTELREGPGKPAAAEIVEIQERHIIVREDGERRVVHLWAEREDRRSRRARPRPPARGRPGVRSRAKLREAVRRVGPDRYEIDGSTVRAKIRSSLQLRRQGRSVASYDNGQYAGFRFVRVPRNGLYGAMGLRRGDTVRAINGKPIASPTDTLRLLQAISKGEDIQLGIERRGRPRTFHYTFK